MTECEYLIKHGGLTPKRLLRKISRRGFAASILGGIASAAAPRLLGTQVVPGSDFTIAIVPDPQFLAESCPDNSGAYYSALMNWIVNHKNLVFTSSKPSFNANIKAVIGVGDCVNSTIGANEFANAENAWTILDTNGIPFITPPGNHDYSGGPSTRDNLGAQFATGYFSAGNRASVYGSGIDLGGGDSAYWIGSYDATGANTAVKLVISGIKMLILAMDFFAGNSAWTWAYDVMLTNSDCECYITTHAWLTTNGTQFQRTDTYGPNGYAMVGAPYSNSAAEAWNEIGVRTWPNLVGTFSGHDVMGSTNSNPSGALSPPWFWQHVPVESESPRRQAVHQLFVNAQQLDASCSATVSNAGGAGQTASVFLLSRRPALGLLEGRMISTQSGNWFGPKSASYPGGTSWSTSETLLFSVPFTGHPERYHSN
jgi:hypothetical protein